MQYLNPNQMKTERPLSEIKDAVGFDPQSCGQWLGDDIPEREYAKLLAWCFGGPMVYPFQPPTFTPSCDRMVRENKPFFVELLPRMFQLGSSPAFELARFLGVTPPEAYLARRASRNRSG